ncbi:MAG TPA: hypothetical protein QGG47_02805 [Acidobacteriota bacterium]|nr:hypothetical protein [Acidobacteriota bacterium]
MRKLQGYGWLVVGAALAAVVPILAIDQAAIAVLESIVPLPWARLGLGVLIFWTAAALYFRSHWSATLGLLEDQHRQLGRTAARLEDIAGDAERSAYLLADNLEEIDVGDAGGTPQALYLEGARAHAAKLAQIGKRCRAASNELTDRRPTAAGDTE